jgi:geranylgeranyl diphosphate synthase type II
MDNDDLRRGRPTSHKKFGEAAAILAGDALLTDAFRLITKTKSSPKAVVDCIRILAESAGYNGMIGGQAKDTIEASKWKMKNKKQSKKDLSYIHKNKTAALISASLLIGATMANASKKQKKALNAYGQKTGLAFQIVDDILDITANKKLLGKKGSDRNNDKLTYPAVYGIEKSKKMAVKLVKEAKNNLRIFDKKAEILGKIADYIIERKF